jgi:hypothetical protein
VEELHTGQEVPVKVDRTAAEAASCTVLAGARHKVAAGEVAARRTAVGRLEEDSDRRSGAGTGPGEVDIGPGEEDIDPADRVAAGSIRLAGAADVGAEGNAPAAAARIVPAEGGMGAGCSLVEEALRRFVNGRASNVRQRGNPRP